MKPRRAGKLVEANWVSDFLGSGEKQCSLAQKTVLKISL